MAAPSRFPAADELVGGDLAERLHEWRDEGLSFDSIAIELREFGIAVTGETVRNWWNKLPEAA